MDTKKCTKCNKIKTINNFFTSKNNSNWCKECKNSNARVNYIKKHPLKNKFMNAKRNYGISEDVFNKLMKKNKCDICKIELIELKDKKIDHCHKTNKIRGLLCNDCNTTLGKLKEDINIMKSMINYIEKNITI